MNSEDNENSSWRGLPITEIYGSCSPWGSPEFPLVVPSHNHTVLYHVPSDGSISHDRPPKPQIGHDKWDQDHVRLPCSSHSLYPVEDSNGETHLKKRWEMIENALHQPIRNSQELAEAILSYNTKFKKIWKFKALHKLFNEYLEEEESHYFFDVTLPEIAKLALSLPKLVQSPIPLLKQDMNKSVSLSQQQIACLLANAFFCTFPRRNTRKKNNEYSSYPHINFSSLYECRGSNSVLEKLNCLFHYFRKVCTKVPAGVVSVSRRSAAGPAWRDLPEPLGTLPLHVDSRTTIEDAHGLIQVDFANRFLGGGVLTYGCVQEEIRFVICPELLITMLFTEMMKPDEAVLIIGCERYSEYSGYSNTFRWTGDYRDATPYDSSGRRRCAVLAIDAKPYATNEYQYRMDMINRELTKAWVGFSFHTSGSCPGLRYPGVGTGNWGCGAYRGCPRLKSLLQAMACAALRRPMAYYTFGDHELRDHIVSVYNMLSRYNVTVGQLYKYLEQYSKMDIKKISLYAFLSQVVENKPMQKDEPELMEISTSSETSQMELSNSIQKEFLKDAASPDMFTQETELTEIIVNTDSQNDVEIKSNEDSKITDHTQKNDKVFDITAASPSKKDNKELNKSSRLLDEMQRLDNEEMKSMHSSPSRQRKSINHDVHSPKKNKSQADAAAEMKKKVNKKITDYFSKKT